jgi:hypothetical protein
MHVGRVQPGMRKKVKTDARGPTRSEVVLTRLPLVGFRSNDLLKLKAFPMTGELRWQERHEQRAA